MSAINDLSDIYRRIVAYDFMPRKLTTKEKINYIGCGSKMSKEEIAKDKMLRSQAYYKKLRRERKKIK